MPIFVIIVDIGLNGAYCGGVYRTRAAAEAELPAAERNGERNTGFGGAWIEEFELPCA